MNEGDGWPARRIRLERSRPSGSARRFRFDANGASPHRRVCSAVPGPAPAKEPSPVENRATWRALEPPLPCLRSRPRSGRTVPQVAGSTTGSGACCMVISAQEASSVMEPRGRSRTAAALLDAVADHDVLPCKPKMVTRPGARSGTSEVVARRTLSARVKNGCRLQSRGRMAPPNLAIRVPRPLALLGDHRRDAPGCRLGVGWVSSSGGDHESAGMGERKHSRSAGTGLKQRNGRVW